LGFDATVTNISYYVELLWVRNALTDIPCDMLWRCLFHNEDIFCLQNTEQKY